MADWLLPKLKKEHSVSNPSVAGAWIGRDGSELNNISEGLDGEVRFDYFDVDSIPDVWARPLLFEMALFDDRHPLHERVRGEWRGLAAMLALREWRGFPLSAQFVDLSEDASEFGRIAERVAPQRTLFADSTWKQFYTLLHDGRALGLTSPTTLFCTGQDYKAYDVPWFDRRLYDPLDVPVPGEPERTQSVLNNSERGAVVKWLEHVEEHVGTWGADRDADLWEKLLGEIQSYRQDLDVPALNIDLKDDVLGMDGTTMFRHLDEVPARPQAQPQNSHVLLAADRQDDGATPLLVLSADIAEQWDVNPKNVKVLGPDTLASAIPFGGLTGPRGQLNGHSLAGAEWRKPEDFFEDSLYFLDEGVFENVLRVDGEQTTGGSPLLPLKSELMDYFTAESLADRLSFREVGGDAGAVEVRLQLPLAGLDGTQRDFTITKTYQRDEVEHLSNVPFLEVWPNFKADDWDEYYTLYDGPGAFYAKPYPAPEDQRRNKAGRSKDITQEVARARSFPEAMQCYMRDGDNFIGLLLLNPPERKSTHRSGTWHVGVDFGTTNTTVYKRDGEAVEPLKFPDRLYSITDRKRLNKTTWAFIPAAEQPTPFPSQYHQPDRRQAGGDEVMLDGNILYLSQHTWNALQSAQEGTLHSNLKWSTQQQDKRLTRQFLTQLHLQIRAEAVAQGIDRIEWSYSVPTSFTTNQREFVKRIWKRITGEHPTRKTESLSAAAYFMEEQSASMMRGAVCIDVGGFSSDVAVWQENEMQLQTSLRFASRHIFLDTILAYPDEFSKRFGNIDLTDPNAIELFLMGPGGDRLMANLDELGDEPEVKLLARYIALGISGLMYYAGLLLCHRADTGRYKRELPYVYLGGNGAKMLYWLHHGGYDAESPTNDLFRRVITESSGITGDHFRLTLTPRRHMKHEVASGLVRRRNLRLDDDAKSVLSGEAFEDGSATQGWDAPLTPDTFHRGLRFEEAAELKKLLTLYNDYAKESGNTLKRIDYDEAIMTDVVEDVNQHLQSMDGQQQGDIDVEPLFIVALKAFMQRHRDISEATSE